jgi:single-strand DNA-binding protein
MFQYSQDAAVKARESFGITESGAYVGALSAKYKTGTLPSKSAGMEFTLETEAGKLQFMYVNYQKTNGEVNDGGYNIINAMMGLLKIPTLTSKQVGEEWFCPEFNAKSIGLVVQKVLTTKSNGGDGYKFEIVMAFSAQSRKTLKEALANAPAQAVDKMLPLLKTKDDRKQGQQGGIHGGYHGYDDVPQTNDLDNLPF